jgi:hypothetical protein
MLHMIAAYKGVQATRSVLRHVSRRAKPHIASAAKAISGAFNSAHPRERTGKFARKG